MRRNTPSKILLGLCISLGLLLIIFVSLINRTEPELLCTVTAAMIQYFVLSTFCWMVFEAITLYLKVVRVIGEFGRHFFLKASIFSFGKFTFFSYIILPFSFFMSRVKFNLETQLYAFIYLGLGTSKLLPAHSQQQKH